MPSAGQRSAASQSGYSSAPYSSAATTSAAATVWQPSVGSAASNAAALNFKPSSTSGTSASSSVSYPITHHPVLTTNDPAVVAAYKPAQVQSNAKANSNSATGAYPNVGGSSVICPSMPTMIGPQVPFTLAPGWASYNAQASKNQGYAMSGMLDSMAAAGYGPNGMSLSQTSESATSSPNANTNGKKRKFIRAAGGELWEDPTLAEWDDNDYRLFCGDLGNEVTSEILAKAFSKYPSFLKAKVVRDNRTNKTKGYGFVSLKDATDFQRAFREMNGKYVGNRPIKLRKSTHKDRNVDNKKELKRVQSQQSQLLGRKSKRRKNA